MSLDYHVYLGPMFVCTVKQVPKTKSHPIQRCSYPSCAMHRMEMARSVIRPDDKYCTRCGYPLVIEEITSRTMETTDVVQSHQVCERLGHTLICPDTEHQSLYVGRHFYLSNERTPRRHCLVAALSIFSFDPRGQSSRFDVIDPNDIPALLDAFRRDWSKELTILQEEYGLNAVEVLWGLVSWSS